MILTKPADAQNVTCQSCDEKATIVLVVQWRNWSRTTGLCTKCRSDVVRLLSSAKPSKKTSKTNDTVVRLRAAIWAIIDTFDAAVANFESRGKGGQQVPFHGDFASMPPSSAQTMRRWSRDLREALRDKWPMLRAEFKAMHGTDEAALDEMFKERFP